MAAFDLSVIIPCFNEEENIEKLRTQFVPVIERIRAHKTLEVLFIDDGSTDKTYPLLSGLCQNLKNFRVIQHPKNMNLGAAHRTGIKNAQGDVILFTDSDGTYAYEEIEKLLTLLTPEVDIVTASPYHPEGGVENVPKYRLFLSMGASLMYRFLIRWNLNTYTAMFRAYRRKVFETVHFESDGFLAVTEIMVHALLQGYRVAEFPTKLRVRVYGQSKARVFQIMLSHFRFQAKLIKGLFLGEKFTRPIKK